MATPNEEWLDSARKYITLTEECECDCFLCIRGEHDEHCEEEKCTCWWGAYNKYAGGTGWDIAKYDPKCPEHGWEEEVEVEASQYGNT
jgi:hypothetical protein